MWEIKGLKQVSAVCQGEKCQFTLMAVINAAGQVLPYQGVYRGRTSDSLPSAQAQNLCDGTHFVFTPGGDKHWRSLQNMKMISHSVFQTLNLG